MKFTLSQPDATFLNVLALNFASVVPKEVVEAEGADFGKKPLGSGAYILDEWVSGQHLIFSRNPDYFRERPNLDGFKVEIGQEPLVATSYGCRRARSISRAMASRRPNIWRSRIRPTQRPRSSTAAS